MSDTYRSSPRPEVFTVLRQLRSRIKRYVFLEGTALVLVVLGLAFWISLALDYWLEIPVGVRRFLLVASAGTTAAAFVWYLLLRLLRDFRNRALAMVLERKFPTLNDRLITAVELADGKEPVPTLTGSMLDRTAAEAAELSHSLQLSEVFNRRPLLRASLIAGALFVSIIGFRWAAADVFQTWFRRNLLMADEFYKRETDMAVVILAEPGERVVEFNKDGVYKHPRGRDLTFRAEVREGKKVPDQVQFFYRNVEHSGRGSDYMTKIGERQFRHKIAGLHDSISLRLQGGDYSTRDPYLVEVVDPPQIDKIVLNSLYPEYTARNNHDEQTQKPVRDPVAVLGTQVSLAAGTDFILQAGANKPLVGVRIQTDFYEIQFSKDSATFQLTAPGPTGQLPAAIPLPSSEPLLAADGRAFSVPFVLAVTPTPEFVSADGKPHLPLRLPPDGLLRIWLHDSDDVMSAEPSRLTVNSIPDEPPRIETRLKGIGTSITRQATIPLVGDIRDEQDATKIYGVTDDYGITDARFEFKLDGKDEPQKFPFAASPNGGKQFTVTEKFSVLPLDLAVGSRFTLRVVAVDGDNLTGPHVASGTPYNFQVVSDDELLALVAVKELNIRRRFEQILDEVRNTRKDVLLHRTRLVDARELRNSADPARSEQQLQEQLAALEAAVIGSVERAINGIRKNANETQSIEQEFGDIRDELENNAVPDVKPMLDRIDNGIVKPLHSITTLDYNNVDDALVLLRKVLEDKADPFSRFDEASDQLGVTIEHLETVLAQMLKLETVNEALQMLRDIIKAEEELQEKTRSERKRKLIEGLK